MGKMMELLEKLWVWIRSRRGEICDEDDEVLKSTGNVGDNDINYKGCFGIWNIGCVVIVHAGYRPKKSGLAVKTTPIYGKNPGSFFISWSI